ncbi:MAG: TolC family protein, partial [Myxococcota bacterium]
MILALLLISAPLTLEEAVSEALRQNETPALVRQQIVSSEAEKRRALARVLPSFDVLGSYTRRLRTATPGGSAVRVANALNAQMNLQSRVVDAPSIPLLQAAGDDLEQTLAAGEDEIRNFAFDVAQAFYAVLASEGLIEAAVERVQLAEVTVNDSRSRFQAGLAGRGDVNRSALELTTARLDLTDLQNVLVQAKLTLGFLIGRPLKESLSPEVHPLVPSGSVQELIAQARRDRPDVEAARYALRAAARRAFEPWLRLVPSVDLLGQLTFTNETGFQGRTLDGSLQLLAVWNLYDGGIRYADRKGFGAE